MKIDRVGTQSMNNTIENGKQIIPTSISNWRIHKCNAVLSHLQLQFWINHIGIRTWAILQVHKNVFKYTIYNFWIPSYHLLPQINEIIIMILWINTFSIDTFNSISSYVLYDVQSQVHSHNTHEHIDIRHRMAMRMK